jgi:hypothetical protein
MVYLGNHILIPEAVVVVPEVVPEEVVPEEVVQEEVVPEAVGLVWEFLSYN